MRQKILLRRLGWLFASLCITLLLNSSLYAQSSVTYHGTVIDSVNAQPIVGVSVIVKGTTQGMQTDASGKFSIDAKPGQVLLLRYIGYKPAEYVVTESNDLTIKLAAGSKGLEEVVVVAYGSQKKKDILGAVTTIDVNQEQGAVATNPSRLLQGEASGVVAKQGSGRPGDDFAVTIRGISSISAGSAPLYVIDGLPVGNVVGQSLNSNDIASITVLKDASSTALYGARGANGVIIITTKKGTRGTTKFTFSSTYGVANVPDSRQIHVLNGPQFAEFLKERYIDQQTYFNNHVPSINEIPADYRYPDSTKYSTNWFKAILHQNAPYSDNLISVSSGNDKSTTYASLDYLSQDGALINTYYKRLTGRVNFDGTPNKYIAFGIHFSGSYMRQNVADDVSGYSGSVIQEALLSDPRYPIYKPDGSFNSYIGGKDGVFGMQNVVQKLLQTVNTLNINDINSNNFIDIKPFKDITIRTNLNAQYENSATHYFSPSTIPAFNTPPPSMATGADASSYMINADIDNLIIYSPTFGKHKIDLTAGHTFQKSTTNTLNASGNTYPDDAVQYLNAATITTGTSGQSAFSEESYFGRLNYSFDDRYLISGSFTREASSRFGANNKWGNFPAASIGWRLTKESFFPTISWLTDLKVRGGYGITGNNNIGNYTSQATISRSNYVLGGNIVPGAVVSSFPNSFLGWEQSHQLNVGTDISLFSGKVSFTAEYYRKTTQNMLLSVQVPSVSGFDSQFTNIGKILNKGFEFSAGYHETFGRMRFNTNANISFNRNKVLSIDNNRQSIITGDFYDGFNITQVGSPIGMFYGYKVLGIYQNQAQINSTPHNVNNIPGTFQYYDGNHDGTISYDQSDMVVIGNPNPKFTWGWNWSVGYKQFDLTVLMNGSYGSDLYDVFRHYGANIDGVFNVITPVMNRWRSEQNPGTGIWPGSNTYFFTRESSSKYVYNGNYTWIKNITLNYTLPKIKDLFDAKIFVSVDNAFLFSNYPGNNPETDAYGGISPGKDINKYPVPRTFSIGAKVNF
jgi:TonB-linked SusC/RagA family outer membrane protein